MSDPNNNQGASGMRNLPKIISATAFSNNEMQEPAQVIHGILHRGSKAVYGGPSKAYKSWNLLDLSLAVSTGGNWLGFPTTRGRVLYINLELQPFALHKRLHVIAGARGCKIPGNLDLWNLRGHGCPMTDLMPALKKHIKGEEYTLIIPDPIYKTLGGRNENDAGDIGTLCAELESVAAETGAAVAFGAHFAKGNASGKQAIDRVSGSGVWARDPDTIITATPHQADGAFTMDMVLRNFPPQQPFVTQWDYPRMTRNASLDPKKLRARNNGRPSEYSTTDIITHLQGNMIPTEWQKECEDSAGISESTFYRLVREAISTGAIIKDGKTYRRAAPINQSLS